MKFLTWGEKLGVKECPYLKRWVLNFGLFSLRIHHWLASDDQRHYHNHAWWFITWVIRGHYEDITPYKGELGAHTIYLAPPPPDVLPPSPPYDLVWSEPMITGCIRFRPANHSHKVKVLRPTWTFLITGPTKHPWGFFVRGKFKRANKYFFEEGHHPCNDGDPPVRTPTPTRGGMGE